VADRVHTAVNAVKAACSHTLGHAAAAEPTFEQLRQGDQSVLARRDPSDQDVDRQGCVTFGDSWSTGVTHPCTLARQGARNKTRLQQN
jgi:hypothetical protein